MLNTNRYFNKINSSSSSSNKDGYNNIHNHGAINNNNNNNSNNYNSNGTSFILIWNPARAWTWLKKPFLGFTPSPKIFSSICFEEEKGLFCCLRVVSSKLVCSLRGKVQVVLHAPECHYSIGLSIGRKWLIFEHTWNLILDIYWHKIILICHDILSLLFT